MSAQRIVRTSEQAVAAAAELGYPVALKVTGIVHKSDGGGVSLDRRNEAEVGLAFEQLAVLSTRVLVQPMAPAGIELIVGSVADATFGSLVMVGLGGTFSDLMSGKSFRLTPVSDTDAATMVQSLPHRLLDGFRGLPRVSRPGLAHLVEQVSALVSAHPEIVELDLNPVLAHGDEFVVVDAKVRVGTALRFADPLAPSLT